MLALSRCVVTLLVGLGLLAAARACHASGVVRSIDEVPVECGGFPDVARMPADQREGGAADLARARPERTHGPTEDPQVRDLTRLSTRARTDSDYLASVVRIKDYLASADFQAMPPIPDFDPHETRIFTPYDDFRQVQKTVIYYRLVLKLLSAADDPFQMTRLYADLALVGTPAATALGSLVLLVQIGTIYEAFRQILMFRVTGIALERRALLAERTLLSVIRRLASHQVPWYSPPGDKRRDPDGNQGAKGRDSKGP